MALERVCREEGLGHDAATRLLALVPPDGSMSVNSKSCAGAAVRGLPGPCPTAGGQARRRGGPMGPSAPHPRRRRAARPWSPIQGRKSPAGRAWFRQARFPVVKQLESFDFNAIPSLNKMLVLDLALGDYIERRENAIGKATSGAYTGNRILRGRTSIAAIPSAIMGACRSALCFAAWFPRARRSKSPTACVRATRVRRRADGSTDFV